MDVDQVALLVERIAERRDLIRENTELKEQLRERYKFDEIVSTSHAMEEALNLAGRVASSNATVLLRGERHGQGARCQGHPLPQPRADQPLVKVNCAALPETLLESELFGHEKGAFTGAAARRIGRFEAADKGTLFLDEIGDLAPAMQVKLLRVLQEKEFERLGGNQTIKTDVRVIAATNRDLEKAIREGAFREDLYYRLNVVSVVIPPLRDRKEDIPALLDHFVKKYSEGNRKRISGVTAEAGDLLMRYTFPGNVRELENIIERAVVLSKKGDRHRRGPSDPRTSRNGRRKASRAAGGRLAERDAGHGGAGPYPRGAQRDRRGADARCREVGHQRAGAEVQVEEIQDQGTIT